ncbi:MAG: ribosome silencing factor [Actinomycetota bacterium]|nr:ribosome silencing factor [Actinomycetota bacterium]
MELESREIAVIAAEAASDKKATDILAIDVAQLLVVTDYFVICTGSNDRQVRSIADEVEEQIRVRCGLKPIGREGQSEGKWVLLDFVDVVVHVFQPDERGFYRLDKLWSDAPRLALPKTVEGRAPLEAPRLSVIDDEAEPVEEQTP